ncbi:MAG TPA: UbiX family flavin prenyltransferase [Gammaproteobacteria bacterium]|nr:UbiX family flavin prenyltransferase [Gammaproteobacteria bacterium]
MTDNTAPVVLAWTGASGMPYGLRLLECLLKAGHEVHLLVSRAAQVVLAMETDLELPARPAEAEAMLRERFAGAAGVLRVFGREQWEAPAASGTAGIRHMVVCPCTTGTLSAIATGASDNLMERAADVIIKEQGKLVLVVRETPLSAIHLENMLKLARLGVVILPANPGFYFQPEGIGDLVDFVVARVLDQLGVMHTLLPRWGEPSGDTV